MDFNKIHAREGLSSVKVKDKNAFFFGVEK